MELFLMESVGLLKECVLVYAIGNTVGLVIAVVAGVILGGLSWWGCSVFSGLWNTRYALRGWHHALCALSALLVFSAVVLGASLRFTQQVAEAVLDGWAEGLRADEVWQSETFTRCYDAVKMAGKENFSGYPDPRDGGNRIPISQADSQRSVAEVSVKSAIDNFSDNHPVLSKVLLSESSVPESVVLSDVKSYFGANPGGTYPHENAIRLAVNHVKSGLLIQAPKVVFYSRLALGGLFLLCFLLTLTAIAAGAYSDIKVHYANA